MEPNSHIMMAAQENPELTSSWCKDHTDRLILTTSSMKPSRLWMYICGFKKLSVLWFPADVVDGVIFTFLSVFKCHPFLWHFKMTVYLNCFLKTQQMIPNLFFFPPLPLKRSKTFNWASCFHIVFPASQTFFVFHLSYFIHLLFSGEDDCKDEMHLRNLPLIAFT